MKTFLQSIFLRFLIYALIMFGCATLIELDFKNGSSNENDIIEISQHLVLLFSIVVGILAASLTKTHKVLMVLLSLFITIHLVREFDAWFDSHFPSIGWFPFVVVILLLALVIIIKYFKAFLNQINSIKNTLGLGILLISLANLHVFTRFYGKPSSWRSIMGDNYLYQVERISEESVELVAYTMIFIAMIEMWLFVKNSTDTSHTSNNLI